MTAKKDDTNQPPKEVRDLPPEDDPTGGAPGTSVPITGVPDPTVPITGLDSQRSGDKT